MHLDFDVNGALWNCAVDNLNNRTWPTSSYLLQRVVVKDCNGGEGFLQVPGTQ